MDKRFEKLWSIITSTHHETLEDAMLADFIDILPFIGDVSNAMRIKDAIDKRVPEYIVAMQIVDFLAGLPPVIGDIIDLLTPTNTIAYLLRKGIK